MGKRRRPRRTAEQRARRLTSTSHRGHGAPVGHAGRRQHATGRAVRIRALPGRSRPPPRADRGGGGDARHGHPGGHRQCRRHRLQVGDQVLRVRDRAHALDAAPRGHQPQGAARGDVVHRARAHVDRAPHQVQRQAARARLHGRQAKHRARLHLRLPARDARLWAVPPRHARSRQVPEGPASTRNTWRSGGKTPSSRISA